MYKDVNGVNWNAEQIAKLYPTQSEFLTAFMPDMGTYPKVTGADRERLLKGVYGLCVPSAKPEKKGAKKEIPQSEPVEADSKEG